MGGGYGGEGGPYGVWGFFVGSPIGYRCPL